MSNFFSYFRESYHELQQVTWPKQEELLRMTIITVVFVIITALILAMVDYGFSQGYQWLLNLSL